VTGVTVIGVRGHFVAVEAHVGRGRREAMSLSLRSDIRDEVARRPSAGDP